MRLDFRVVAAFNSKFILFSVRDISFRKLTGLLRLDEIRVLSPKRSVFNFFFASSFNLTLVILFTIFSSLKDLPFYVGGKISLSLLEKDGSHSEEDDRKTRHFDQIGWLFGKLPSVDELVDLVICLHHRRTDRLPVVEASRVRPRALHPVLTVLGSLHVLEEPEDVRVVSRWFPQLVQFPGKSFLELIPIHFRGNG